MKILLKLLLVLFSAFIPGSLVIAAETVPPANCEARPYDTGRLWKISKPGKPASFVFGTMHSKDPRILFLPGIIMQAFTNASVVVVETSLKEENVAGNRAIMFGAVPYSLKKNIGEKRFQRLEKLTSFYGFNAAALDRLKIWAAAAVISQPPEPKHSGDKALTLLDRELEKTAYQTRKAVFPLESMTEQLSLFDRLEPSVQIELLDEAIENFEGQEAEIAKISRYYLKGRMGWIFCVLEEGLVDASPSLVHFMKTDLLTDRNVKMVQRMMPLVEQGGAFVAIGALHLPGDTGIVALLEKQGYKIERQY